MPRKKCRSGFTLIELLVVISIIALLLALVLPALHVAREQARSVKCKSNLRHVALALYSYAQDSRDLLPPYMDGFFEDGDSYTSPLDNTLCTQFCQFYLYTTWVTDDYTHVGLRDGDGYLQPHLNTPAEGISGIPGCPSVTVGPQVIPCSNESETWQELAFRGMTYLLNVEALSLSDLEPRKMSNIERPSELVVMCEGSGTASAVNAPGVTWDGGEPPEPRHKSMFNAAFLDTHVQCGSLDALYTNQYFLRD